ncbi:MAG: enoyl-CoA hydratase/isomerase family protein [Myxococcota bacterium]
MALSQSSYQAMRIEKRPNGVAVVTLHRPERLNAVNAQLHHELARFTRDAEADPDVKVVVLTGAGRAFCAGGDFSAGASPGGLSLEEARQIVDHLLELRKPIISAVQGYAMGLGATIALLCDVVVAGHSSVFADTHVAMGIGAGDGGQVIWPLLMGVNRAKWFLMTGERVTGEQLRELGLVTFLVEDDEILPRALACADQLAAGPSRAISASKVPINHYIRMISNLVLPLSLSLEGETMRSEDAREAARAFQEKRKPSFSGR